MLRPLIFFVSVLALGQSVPTPESVLGHKPGDDFYLANYDESRDYFHKLAAASNRVKIINVGKTTRGLDWEIAIISSPQNLAQLDKYKDISRRLAQGRGLTDESARALAREGKAIVHIDGGLHSTEVAGAQQSIALAYKLVSAQGDPEVDAILDNVILMLWPTLNPDGQNEVVGWYRKNVGTSYEVSPLPDLYQEYVGHDNNRDGYMNNMLESRDVTKTELEWDPVIFYCHHQTAPFPTRIFIPPFTEPISSNINPLMARWLNVLGINMAAYLDEHGMPGAVHRVGFDNWYPGFLDFTHIFRNSISFFTETALYRYATPHFYTVDEFPKDRQLLMSEVFYSSPWKGGWWRLADAVRYMLGGSMAVLDTAAKYRETLLYNRYQAARDNIQRFQKEPPFAYLIPQQQRDLPTAATLVDKLLTNGIEVHQAEQSFSANGREYKNAWVILMDQPFSPLVKELLEPQHYPDIRQFPGGPPVRPYDVAGWTLPMQMGVEVATVSQPLTAAQRAGLKPIDHVTFPAGGVQGTGATYVLSRQVNASFATLNEVLAGGGQASFSNTAIATPNGNETGAIILTGLDRERVNEIARKHSASALAIAKAPADVVATKKPRVGLYRSWVGNIDEGWTRWILENYGFAPVTLRNGDIQAGHLRDRLDAIILPDASTRQIMDGFAQGTISGEYAGGLGEAGADALRTFVRGGGTLIAFNNASNMAIESFALPVTNVLQGLTNEQFYCSGSLLRLELRDTNHPLVWGMPREPIVMFERGPAFDTKAGFRGTVLASYSRERNPLASGYLLHPERIQGKIAALEAFYGDGRVYLLGFRPQWRGQSHGTYKLVFNAIYDSPSLAKPTAFQRAAEPANPTLAAWRAATAKVHSDLAPLIADNRAFFAAKGPAAVEARSKLSAALDQFEKDRIPEVEDAGAGMDDASRRKVGEYVRQMRRLAADLRSKEVEANVDGDGLLDRYRLAAIEQELGPRRPN
ncbi:MAG TPA: M14 metallopeptidase family protein [Bryobacteraceae bacterium]|nr:M14 metallopeptidase family protein [Bryobacteraceae bacterium]